MTKFDLRCFKEAVSRRALSEDPTASFETVDLGIVIDVSKLDATVTSGIAKVKGGASTTSLDEHVAWDLYETLKGLPDLITSDVRLWQWLTLTKYREFSETRTGIRISSIVKNEDFKRVLGANSLNGMNRQVLWKLFLAASGLNATKESELGFRLCLGCAIHADAHRNILQGLKRGSLPA